MKKHNALPGAAAALGMLVLILDGQTAIMGASQGVALCIKSVIPSLFPFFLLSNILTSALTGTVSPLLRPISLLFGTPEGTEALLLTSFLGGYPLGAQSVANAYKTGHLRKADASRMLLFCNQAGPSFLFGMVTAQFPSPWYAWLIWGIQLTSAWLVASCFPANRGTRVHSTRRKDVSPAATLQGALNAMAGVCGWVVMFRVILAFLERWFLWMVPQELQVLVTGFLELANGCCSLSRISQEGLRLIVCSMFLSFGGLCVLMQTSSCLENLSLGTYLKGKSLQTLFSFCLACVCQVLPQGLDGLAVVGICALTALFLILHRKMQNNCGICPEPVV